MTKPDTTIPRPRPIDLLFGEMDDAIPDHSSISSEETAAAPRHEAGDGTEETIADQVPAPRDFETSANAIVPTITPPQIPGDYMILASTIDSLYQQMSVQESDSPQVREYCLSLLNAARGVLESEDYAGAGYEIQQVKARLLRARLMERPPGIGRILDEMRRAPAALLHALGRAFSTADEGRQVSW